jgi:hypothetical protein
LLDIVNILLENGANQNIIESEHDFYPIFYSVVQNNFEITKLLVDYGANPNRQDYLGNTIIHYSILGNHSKIIDYIINKYQIQRKKTKNYVEDINNKEDINAGYINPNIINIDGLTSCHIMLYNYKTDYDVYLFKLIPHVNLNYQDNLGNTILHILTENNLWEKYINIINVKKMNIYIKNNKGKTIFDMVQLKDKDKFINLITYSFYNHLKKFHNQWLLEWQNKCSNEKLDKIDEDKCINQIKDSIIYQKISMPTKKGKKIISIDQGNIIHFSTFTGSLLDTICGFKYLIKKYPDVSTLFHSQQKFTSELEKYNQSLGIIENQNQHLIHFEIRWIYQRIFLPPGFEIILENIIKSGNCKYIIIPIGIILSSGNHSNALFYNIETHELERFEPHGSDYPSQFNYNPDLLDEILYKRLTHILSIIYDKPILIKYYQPKNYLPKIGFQTFENSEININKNIGDPNGFCTLWCIWYLDYRLKYINDKPDHIVKKLITEIRINNLSFRTIIRNYSKNITDLRDKYLSHLNKNINDYLNNKIYNT